MGYIFSVEMKITLVTAKDFKRIKVWIAFAKCMFFKIMYLNDLI